MLILKKNGFIKYLNSKILHEIKQNKPGKIYTLCYVKNNLLKLQRDLLKVRTHKQKILTCHVNKVL